MSIKIAVVPDTETFSLQEVSNAVGYNNLFDCFSYSTDGLFSFDYAYPAMSLLRFRKFCYDTIFTAFSNSTKSINISPYSGNRILILQIASEITSVRPVGTPTFNGVSLSQAGSNNGSKAVEIWYMINPPVGTFNLYIPNNTYMYCHLSIYPSAGTISYYSSAFQSGTSTVPSTTISTSATKSLVIANLTYNQDTRSSGGISSKWISRNWVYYYASNGRVECGIFTPTNPLTINFSLGVSSTWQMAVSIFNVS